MGLAMNLEEHEVGAVILGDDSKLKEGDLVKCSGRLLSVPVGRSLLGRVVNTLGEPIDGKGPIEAEAYYPVEKIASGIISRQSVSVPVQTGILPIDAMIPIGRAARTHHRGPCHREDRHCHGYHDCPGGTEPSGGGRQAS